MASRKTVEPRPTSRVLSATWREKYGAGLPWMRMKASRLSWSVLNSSMPSRSWFPPTTSYGTPKPLRNSDASSWQRVVPAKSSAGWSTALDSPRSPTEHTTAGMFLALLSSMIALKWLRPSFTSSM